MEILNALMVLAAESAEGLKFIAIGLAALSMAGSAIGEGLVVAKAMEGMSRNPEMYGKLRTGMILGCSLVETTAIYALLIAILLLFVVVLPQLDIESQPLAVKAQRPNHWTTREFPGPLYSYWFLSN